MTLLRLCGCTAAARRFVRDIGASEMNHHHRKTLQAIFAHPVSAIISVFENFSARRSTKSPGEGPA